CSDFSRVCRQERRVNSLWKRSRQRRSLADGSLSRVEPGFDAEFDGRALLLERPRSREIAAAASVVIVGDEIAVGGPGHRWNAKRREIERGGIPEAMQNGAVDVPALQQAGEPRGIGDTPALMVERVVEDLALDRTSFRQANGPLAIRVARVVSDHDSPE